jgi:biotin carboxylase
MSGSRGKYLSSIKNIISVVTSRSRSFLPISPAVSVPKLNNDASLPSFSTKSFSSIQHSLSQEQARSASSSAKMITQKKSEKYSIIAYGGVGAAKAGADLKSMGTTVYYFHTPNDSDAPYIQDAKKEGRTVQIESYGAKGLPSIKESAGLLVTKLNAEHVKKCLPPVTIVPLHTLWGQLAENAVAAKEIDAIPGVAYAGPVKAMEEVSSKIGFREIVAEVEKKLGMTLQPMRIKVPQHTLYEVDHYDYLYQGYFEEIKKNMHGVAYVKATELGGGAGIIRVEVDNGYEAFKEEGVKAAIKASLKNGGKGIIMIEAEMPTSQHFELQLLIDREGVIVIKQPRNCSVQIWNKKYCEFLTMLRDLDAWKMDRLYKRGLAIGQALFARGYLGVVTLEFMGELALEANTRLQVEHPVTESGVDEAAKEHNIAMKRPFSLIVCLDEITRGGVMRDIMKDYFLKNPADAKDLTKFFSLLTTTRIAHMRVCPLKIDPANRVFLPTNYNPAADQLAASVPLAEGTRIAIGGCNIVDRDPLVIATWGRLDGVKENARALQKAFSTLDKHGDNLSYLLNHVCPRVFKENGDLNENVTTRTFHEELYPVTPKEYVITPKHQIAFAFFGDNVEPPTIQDAEREEAEVKRFFGGS